MALLVRACDTFEKRIDRVAFDYVIAAHELQHLRLEEERVAAEVARRAEEERRAAELLAEQKQFHDRVMWAIYIGLGLLALFVGSKLLKNKE